MELEPSSIETGIPPIYGREVQLIFFVCYKEKKGEKIMKNLVLCFALLLAMVGCSKKSMKWEMVIHARGGRIENTRLVLEDIDQYVSAFTVGKPRKVVSVPLQDLVSEWDKLFANSEPNATLSMRTAQKEQKEQVVILKKPQLVGGQLIFAIEQKSGQVQGAFTDALLFVDILGCYPIPEGCVD